jgi:hypothetical protein
MTIGLRLNAISSSLRCFQKMRMMYPTQIVATVQEKMRLAFFQFNGYPDLP